MEAELFESHDWVTVSEDASITELHLKGRRLVLRHSKKRADKDAHERDRIVEKLKRSLTQGIKGSGKRGRFLKVDRNAVELNQDAIDRDACFDGLHGVWTQPGSRKSPGTTHLCILRGAVAHRRGLSRAQAHHGDAAHLSLDPPARQRAHRDLLRRLLPCCACCATSTTPCMRARSHSARLVS